VSCRAAVTAAVCKRANFANLSISDTHIYVALEAESNRHRHYLVAKSSVIIFLVNCAHSNVNGARMESEPSGNKDNLREWLYIDTATSTQRGPVTLSLLIKMLEKGAGATSTTLVWKAGMENWLPMAEVKY
jgi:GYF domain 2